MAISCDHPLQKRSYVPSHSVPADSYLFKPFELAELERRVATALKHWAQAGIVSSRGTKHRFEERFPIPEDHVSRHQGSLVSMSATLKLLSRGQYGNGWDVANTIKTLLSKTDALIR